MHREGISIASSMFETYIELHFKQIINFKQTTAEDITKTNKSIVGRAVVGGLIMGPLGAIVGGMSGMNKDKTANINFLVINYWDLETKQAQTLLIRGKKADIILFVGRLSKEKSKSKDNLVVQKQESSNNGGCTSVIALLVIAVEIISSLV